MPRNKTKYIFVTGGVMSSVGKGVSTASLGYLLQQRGYKVTAVKYEGYLNVDAGTINPIEHGDPFLCEDGTEADMDLGTYERYLGQKC
jgi:CTP synthase